MYWDDKYGTHTVSSDVSFVLLDLVVTHLKFPMLSCQDMTLFGF